MDIWLRPDLVPLAFDFYGPYLALEYIQSPIPSPLNPQQFKDFAPTTYQQ
jgi:hypothetical protein